MFTFQLLDAIRAAQKCRTVLNLPTLLGVDSNDSETGMNELVRATCEELRQACMIHSAADGKNLGISEEKLLQFQNLYIAHSRDTGDRPLTVYGDPDVRTTYGTLQQAAYAICDEIDQMADRAIKQQ